MLKVIEWTFRILPKLQNTSNEKRAETRREREKGKLQPFSKDATHCAFHDTHHLKHTAIRFFPLPAFSDRKLGLIFKHKH